MELDKIDLNALKATLKKFPLIEKVYFFDEIDSTNDKAIRLVKFGLQQNSLLLAEYQTKGRGRFSRVWLSPKSEALLFSIILFPGQPEDKWQLLTLLTSITVAECLEKLSVHPVIKWPNDALVNNGKISGILTEISHPQNTLKKSGVAIGVGININQSQFNQVKSKSPKPTSLFLETGKIFKRIEILERFLILFSKHYKDFESGNFHKILESWKKLSSTIGKGVKLETTYGELFGTATGIEEDGGLLVRLDSGIVKKITAADVVEIDWK